VFELVRTDHHNDEPGLEQRLHDRAVRALDRDSTDTRRARLANKARSPAALWATVAR
jgi:hypothetical protein